MLLAFTLLLSFLAVNAFVPRLSKRSISPAQIPIAKTVRRFMSSDDFARNGNPVSPSDESTADEEPQQNEEYLQESKALPPSSGLSDNMRQKLLQESRGNDANYSAGPILGNPILLISGIVAILVVLGGKGYFF